MIKLYICCLVLIIGSVEVGPDIDMKFHREVMEFVSYDKYKTESTTCQGNCYYVTFAISLLMRNSLDLVFANYMLLKPQALEPC